MATKLQQMTAALALAALAALALAPDSHADGRRRFSHGGSPRFAAPHAHHPRPHLHHHGHARFRAAIVLAAPVIAYHAVPRPVIIAPPPPPVSYIERSPYVPPGHAEGYWYWCASASAYYPYVAYCPEGWQQVVPRPTS